jgi:hypothetical protein
MSMVLSSRKVVRREDETEPKNSRYDGSPEMKAQAHKTAIFREPHSDSSNLLMGSRQVQPMANEKAMYLPTHLSEKKFNGSI